MPLTSQQHAYAQLTIDQLRDTGLAACREGDVARLRQISYQAHTRGQTTAFEVLQEIIGGLNHAGWPPDRATIVYETRCFWQTNMLEAAG